MIVQARSVHHGFRPNRPRSTSSSIVLSSRSIYAGCNPFGIRAHLRLLKAASPSADSRIISIFSISVSILPRSSRNTLFFCFRPCIKFKNSRQVLETRHLSIRTLCHLPYVTQKFTLRIKNSVLQLLTSAVAAFLIGQTSYYRSSGLAVMTFT